MNTQEIKEKLKGVQLDPSTNAFVKECNEFYRTHPDVPEAKDVPCLNLIMRKEFAEAILRGEKNVEYRAYSNHYCERLFDHDVDKYVEDRPDDMDIQNAVENGYIDSLRKVTKIHFHNYSNSWYLDVECIMNDIVSVTPDDVAYMADMYGDHELEGMLNDLERRKESERPLFFYFVLGDVIKTNLK